MTAIRTKFYDILAAIIFLTNSMVVSAQEKSVDLKGSDGEAAVAGLIAVARNQGGTLAQ